MSEPSRSQRRRAGRARLPLYALLLATCFVLLWIVASRPILGVPGQHDYAYRPVTRWGAAPLLVLLALPCSGALAFVLCRRGGLSRGQEWAVAGALTAGSLLLHMGTACAPKLYPGAELAWSFLERHREGAYARRAPEVRALAPFLSNYAHWLDVSPVRDSPHWVRVHHAEVHPPGLTLSFAALERFYDRWPRVKAAVDSWSDSLFPSMAVMRQHPEAHRVRHPVPVAMTAATAAIVLAGLMPLACFVAARAVWPAEAALVAAALCALIPGTHLFNPSVDHAYPTAALLLCALGVRALKRSRWGWGIGFGVLLFAMVFVHVGLALVAVVFAAACAVAWRADHWAWGARDVARACWPPVAGAALGFLTPAFALQLSLGYPTFRVALLCLRNNSLFNAEANRTYWGWLTATPFEFGLSLGFAVALVAGLGWLAEAVAALRKRSLRGRSAPLLAVGSALLALTLLGLNRGETARLWLFLIPLLTVAAVGHVWHRAREPRPLLAALAGLQALQTIVLSVLLDAGLTTSFFVGLLRRG